MSSPARSHTPSCDHGLLTGMTLTWQIVLKIMTVGFLVSFITQVVTMIVTLINILREFAPHFGWPCVCLVLIL